MTKLRTFGLLAFVPTQGRKACTMGKLSGWKTACAIPMLCAATAIGAPATTTFTTLASFDGANGAHPAHMSLVQGTDGSFYGTTYLGGANNDGTVFKITSGGTLTTLYSFCAQTNCGDGSIPQAGLVQATDGNIYGTTAVGGANSEGTIFKVTSGGTLTTLYSFCAQTNCTDGSDPVGGLVQAADGNFYGTTYHGGTNNFGTVFKITSGGKLTTLHSFDSTDGMGPQTGVGQGTDGNFYGTTQGGGRTGDGTVFKITPGGTLTTLHSFGLTNDGIAPLGLIQATDGNFYGTTQGGGANSEGTIFKITSGGTLTTLYSFCAQSNCADGSQPFAGLVQATDGNFYGTTQGGGANSEGTIFKITSGGTLTALYSFCAQTNCADGSQPFAGLVQATDGNFYGTTYAGGVNNFGTVFSLAVGLGPFVETRPSSGKVGAKVIILGTNLKGATSASFNGTAATFTVVSASEINTTVPAGATTGKVQVKTPSGTLKSNLIFKVTPQLTSFKPTSGEVGTSVTITGVSLKQTTVVTFGGVKATAFIVNSGTQVTATVPTGAKTGKIDLTTPGGTATSATSFTVTP
jgi:uncharacterized repeat protein (TIGR03803 family)